jgi:hypothetical protein
MNRGSRDTVTFRQLAKTLTMLAIAQDAAAIELEWLTSDRTTFELGPSHAGSHSFDDQVAFQFRNGSDDHDDRPTERSTGIELFVDGGRGQICGRKRLR